VCAPARYSIGLLLQHTLVAASALQRFPYMQLADSPLLASPAGKLLLLLLLL
jgi:hypothetical protein